jgi:hypothetical protein
MKKLFVSLLVTGVSCVASAKLPVPVLDDAAKAKAAEAAAKTAWSGKFEGFLLCKSMDKAAAHFQKTAAAAGKTVPPAVTTPPCADPGAFVYPPVAAPAVAAAPAAVPAAPAPVPAKKS